MEKDRQEKKPPEKRDRRVEIRRLKDGSIDEVLLYVDGESVFHMEKLDENLFWFVLYDGEEEGGEHFHVGSEPAYKSRVIVSHHRD